MIGRAIRITVVCTVVKTIRWDAHEMSDHKLLEDHYEEATESLERTIALHKVLIDQKFEGKSSYYVCPECYTKIPYELSRRYCHKCGYDLETEDGE
jgi:hypothetical protein